MTNNKEYYEKQIKYGEEFIKTMDKHINGKMRNLELSCMSKRFIVPAILCDFATEKGDFEKADEYNKLYVDWVN